MDPRTQQNRRQFFSEQNEAMLYGMLAKNFQQRLGSSLTQNQSTFLEGSLERWMSEVFQENSNQPVQALNKGVISATASDFNAYLQRQEALASATPQMFQETAQRYDQFQADRQRSLEPPRPTVPDYVQPIQIKEDDSTSALALFEEAKKRRNMEMSTEAETQIASRAASALQPLYLQQPERPDMRTMYDKPLDLVIAGQQQELPGRGDINSTIARPGPSIAPRGSLQQDMIIRQEDIQNYKETEFNLSVYSADRKWEVDGPNNENRFNFSVNLFSGNHANGLSIMPKGSSRLKNIVRIEFVKAVVPIEVTQMVVRKTSNTRSPDQLTQMAMAMAIAIASSGTPSGSGSGAEKVTYEANEAAANVLNFINSNDLGLNPAKTGNPVYSYNTEFVKTLYEFPFITLNVDELDTNTYGTSNSMDNAFGILQYDSNWTDNTDSMGYTSLIPKHMKCQRVYSPTPLASLNKLTIRLQQPNGSLVNTTSDTLDISGIFISKTNYMGAYFQYSVDIAGTSYSDLSGEYIWIDTKQWFSRYQISIGDRIVLRNLTTTIDPTKTKYNNDFLNYVQDPAGHIVVGTAYSKDVVQTTCGCGGGSLSGVPTNTTVALIEGTNHVGYSRFIIIRARFEDPTTGNHDVLPFGQTPYINIGPGLTQGDAAGPYIIGPGKLINMSRQTQFIFRVITREYDSTSVLRPDNL